MSKGCINKEAVSFYIEDLKDTSEKLESTDKKCQFVIQLYSSLATIIISAFVVMLEKGIINTRINPIWVLIMLLFLITMGEFIFQYMVGGNKIHVMYLNRMNTIRALILNECGLDNNIQNKYSFTNQISANTKGMGYTMLIMVNTVLFLLFASGIAYILLHNISFVSIVIAVSSFLLMTGLFFYNRASYKKSCESANEYSKKIHKEIREVIAAKSVRED